MNWIKGRHNFKFGFELLHLQFEQIFIGSPGFSFNGTRSGDPLADFMLGAFSSLSLDFGVRDTNTLTNAMSAFFQDEFKVTPRLTLTLGVRYEPFLPWIEKNNRIDTVVPGKQSTSVPDAPLGVIFPGRWATRTRACRLEQLCAAYRACLGRVRHRKDLGARWLWRVLRKRQRRFPRAGKSPVCRLWLRL